MCKLLYNFSFSVKTAACQQARIAKKDGMTHNHCDYKYLYQCRYTVYLFSAQALLLFELFES